MRPHRPLWLLNLIVWLTALIPTRSELRDGLLYGGVVFLVIVALSPLWLLLAGR